MAGEHRENRSDSRDVFDLSAIALVAERATGNVR
jgi:hypothetical protein